MREPRLQGEASPLEITQLARGRARVATPTTPKPALTNFEKCPLTHTADS